VAVSELTMAELRFKQAQLTHDAEAARVRWRGMINTSPSALAAGRRVKDLQSRADDYQLIIAYLESVVIPRA
jgi:hypothetical protein